MAYLAVMTLVLARLLAAVLGHPHVHRCADSRRPAGEATSPQRTITVQQNGPEMKRYKYQALVTLLPQCEGQEAPLRGPICRMVVRARHRETGASKIFSALVTTSEGSPLPGNSHIIVTLEVLGDDARDYLSPGEGFVLWRGWDIGRGVVTRRIFV